MATPDEHFICPICGREFSSAQGVKAHKREVHPSPSRRRSRNKHRKMIANLPAPMWGNSDG